MFQCWCYSVLSAVWLTIHSKHALVYLCKFVIWICFTAQKMLFLFFDERPLSIWPLRCKFDRQKLFWKFCYCQLLSDRKRSVYKSLCLFWRSNQSFVNMHTEWITIVYHELYLLLFQRDFGSKLKNCQFILTAVVFVFLECARASKMLMGCEISYLAKYRCHHKNYNVIECQHRWESRNEMRNRPMLCQRCGWPNYPYEEVRVGRYNINRGEWQRWMQPNSRRWIILTRFACVDIQNCLLWSVLKTNKYKI